MRIVYVIEKISARGGQERILIDKMNYLAEHTSDEIVLMTIWHDDKPCAYPLYNKVRHECLNITLLPVPCGYAMSLPFVRYSFDKRVKELCPDITIFFRAMGAFLIATTSWKGVKLFESHLAYQASNHNWLYPYMQRKADMVVCLTNGDAKEFNIARRVEVIPNFTLLKTEQSPDYNASKVVFVGRDCPEKDLPRLHRIWDAVSKTHPGWTLAIHHNTQDIVRAYLEASILVMTSRAEGFGLVLIEAMSCGLPCIAFDCPYGPSDIIEDGRTGYLILNDDEKVYIDRLSALMDDASLRQLMGQEARKSAERFSQDVIMDRWQQLFNSIISTRSKLIL